MKDQKLTVRVLSLALVVCMLVGMLPLSVIAAENTANGDFTEEEAPQYLLFAGNRSGVATAIGAESVQYGAFHLTNGTETANFKFTTLLPGQSMVVLESGRMPWRSDLKFSELTVDNVALFDAAPGLCEDQVQVTVLDGMVRIENVSGKDITGDVVAYYKNVAQDLLYGGITYRVRAEGGLKAGECVDILASHCSAKGSRIVFVTCD